MDALYRFHLPYRHFFTFFFIACINAMDDTIAVFRFIQTGTIAAASVTTKRNLKKKYSSLNFDDKK